MPELICGLETHVELATKTKIFCSCTTAFGGAPNTHCCPVCTGQPGALPVLNAEVVRFAVRAGLALNCRINTRCHMDRKNYTYPDLPKAYQISQYDEPVCEDGYIELDSGKKIGIERIHIEEDAGKLVHENGVTLIDYNRGGVPLIEIVSRPDIRTPEEAAEYAEKLQLTMRFIGVSDCKMQEGSMRCDVNISLHEPGTPFGVRTELKNINSLSNIVKAMNREIERQEGLIASGEGVRQATLRYDAGTDKVSVMRFKENSDDYRYFPEPDILRFEIPEDYIASVKENLPELPKARYERFVSELGLSAENANQLFRYKKVGDFLDSVTALGASPRNTANLIIRGIYSGMASEEEKENFDIKTGAGEMAELVKLTDEKKLSFNRAVEILPSMCKSGRPVMDYLSAEDTAGVDDKELEEYCKKAIELNPKAAEDIRNGKDRAINVLFGYIMKQTRGKADTKKAAEIIKSLL